MLRLIENVYEADKDGALRLTERIPVNGEVRRQDGRVLHFFAGDDVYHDDITELLTGNNPKFTLTEDPMHDNCAPCQAGLPEETHEPPDTMLKIAAKTILLVLADATAAAFMQWCG